MKSDNNSLSSVCTDNAAECLKHFAILYPKNYGLSLYLKIKNEEEGSKRSKYKLSHREVRTFFLILLFVIKINDIVRNTRR